MEAGAESQSREGGGTGMLRQQWGFRQVSEYSFRFWVREGMCLKGLLISFVT